MNDRHARSFREIMRESPSIDVSLTDHQAFIARHTIALRIASLSEEFAKQVKADAYTISNEQVVLRAALKDLIDLSEELT